MMQLTRRQLLHTAGAGAATLVLSPLTALAADKDDKPIVYVVPKLPYDYDALEPHIDAQTMHIHHDKHHQAYVDNLNKALAGAPAVASKPLKSLLAHLDQVPEAIRAAVRNNGGGHVNHSMFWEMMAKGGGGKPNNELGKAIDAAFGSFAKFQDAFTDAAMKRFGSGWAWLVVGKEKLEVVSTPNQDTPLSKGQTAILGLDVWEHAYYLKYQNRRADYVKAWWNVVNWKDATERYVTARKDK